ncbi:MAG: PepSY domain-containing protein [Actinomycetes bacterium]
MRKYLIGAVATAVVGVAAGGVAVAGTGDTEEPERAITGAALEQASAAALDHTGGGRVTGTEVGDEESYYEVEVTRPDGTQVDVQLDRQFSVVGDEDDDSDKGAGED